MSGAKPTRTRVVSVRVQPTTFDAAERVAAVTGRTISSLAEYALRRFIEKNHPTAFDANAKVVIEIDDAPSEAGSAS